jgi:hypothetical protein
MKRGIGVVVGWVAAFLATAAFAEGPGQTPPRSPFNDWSAIVVAGDWRSGDGRHTEAFDNARRDVAATLVALGVKPENITQLSTRPDGDAAASARLTPRAMVEGMRASAARTRGGCLVYYTSHGSPDGVVLDIMGRVNLLSPKDLALFLDNTCPGRPAIVFVSACYSGVFVPHLQGPQRMVMTAARGDRSSFGCSTDDKYPFFDDCFLQSVGKARNFPALAPAIQACVARKETDLGLGPPSEPQVSIGPDLRLSLSMMPFPSGAKGVQSP